MTFERKETFFGLPISPWKAVPEGRNEVRFDGLDPIIGFRNGKTLSVDIVTDRAPDDSSLTVSAVTKISDSWTTYRSVQYENTIYRGTSNRARVFTTAPGHQVVYRWSGKK